MESGGFWGTPVESVSSPTTSTGRMGIALDQLPPEIFLHICHYLDARFVSETLSSVCSRFKELIDDDSMWKARMIKKWSGNLPIYNGIALVPKWRDACILREEHYKMWVPSKSRRIRKESFPQIHNGEIDALHILNKHPSMLATASRDRGFCLWNLEKWPDETDEMLIHNKLDAHEGWIWCLESSDSQLFSGSWDKTIRVWDLQTCDSVISYKCSWTVFGLATDNHCVYGGSSPHLYKVDLRDNELQVVHRHHKGPIFSVLVHNNWVVSASEDSTIKAFDLRNNKVFFDYEVSSYPSCLSYDNGVIWAGDSDGNLHMFDAQNWAHVTCVPGLSESLIKVRHSLGSILAYSRKNFYILEPSLEPKLMKSIEMVGSDITGVASYKNTLLLAGHETITGWISEPCEDEVETL